MKKFLCLLLTAAMLMGVLSVASAEQTVYTGTSKGFASDVTVTVTLEDGKVVALDVDDSGESYTLAGIQRENSVDKLVEAILASGGTEGVDATTGATFTSTAVLNVVNEALAGGADETPVAFTAGEYTATARGYNGNSTFKVTLLVVSAATSLPQ